MSRHQRNTKIIFHQNHQCLFSQTSETLLQVFCVTGKMKLFILYIVFIDRSCYQYIHRTTFQVGNGSLQSQISGFASNSCRLTQLNFSLVIHTIDNVHPVYSGIFSLCNDTQIYSGQLQGLSVISGDLRRTVNDRRAKFGYTSIRQCFQYHLVTDTIYISVGNAHLNQSFFHIF